MAIVDTCTSLTIQEFSDFVGIDPFSFNELDTSNCPDVDCIPRCTEVWTQHHIGYDSVITREELAQYIQYAEDQIENWLGSFVKPKWTQCEELEYPYCYRREDGKVPYKDVIFTTKWKNVLEFGKPRYIKLGTYPVVYEDRDGDGYNETGIIEFESETNDFICFKALFANKLEEGDGDICMWEVKPVSNISYDPYTMQGEMRIESWLLVDPELYFHKGWKNKKALNACDPDIYVQEVDIYIEQKDPCEPEVELVWTKDGKGLKDIGIGHCRLCGDDCNCNEMTMTACANVLNSCEGRFTLSLNQINTANDPDCCVTGNCPCMPCIPPDLIRVNYLSGCSTCKCGPGSSNCVCPQLKKAIIALAVSDFPRPTCHCSCLQDLISIWQRDMTRQVDGDVFRTPIKTLTDNPFAQTVGARETYNILEVMKSRGDFCYRRY